MPSKEKAKPAVDAPSLPFGLPDFAASEAECRTSDVSRSLARFEQLLAQPDSPVRAIRRINPRPAESMPLPEDTHPLLRQALAQTGITQLFTHQALAYQHVRQGRNVVVVTPTASGKTLCYNLPVLQRILEEPGARAFYLFPTKALAEDQLASLTRLIDASGAAIGAFTYDGDTPQDARRKIRERANIVLTNPDMLHSGILPHHTRWAKAFENLRYFVIDELHAYRGVFGSHLANLLRRLRRICHFYGSQPTFICCSATIANPQELAERLTGQTFELVDRNGAPAGEKYFVFWNPPVVNRQLGIRRSYLHETRRLARELIERGQQTLVFANHRLAMEVLLTYLKSDFQHAPMGSAGVRGYRGGYLPRQRREIERSLRDGDVRAVVSTNALELGVDIGSLDAVILAGYPGTISATLQRAGRAGRRQRPSLAVLVASSAPLDQYVVEHPDYFFENSPEHACINPDNLEIALQHLRCAAFELPLRQGEVFGSHPIEPLCAFLEEAGFLHKSGRQWHWIADSYPADAVSLRSVTSDNFVVIDVTRGEQVIGEVSFSSALTTLHEKAIYLHEATPYQVERFDYEGRKAYVRRTDCDYFTEAIDYTQINILEVFDQAPLAGASAAHGDVRVNRQVVGWKKIKFHTLENVGSGHLFLPEQEIHTTAFWLHFPNPFLNQLTAFSPDQRQSGVTGLGHALRSIAALLLMCDPHDLGLAFSGEQLPVYEPDLFLYDAYPGGIGQSLPLFKLRHALLAHAHQLIQDCPCELGCPSCVGPPGEVGDGGKQAALALLALLLQPSTATASISTAAPRGSLET